MKDNVFKIAMLGHKRVPSREGGVEIVVEELATRMVKNGYDVTCLNRAGHHIAGQEFDKKEYDTFKGIKLETVFTIDAKGLAAMTSSFFGAIRGAFGDFDVVHFHAEGPCAMIWIPKLLGKRCIATIHGLDWKREKWKNGFGSQYIKFGEKMAVKYADEIIVLSKGVQDYFKETYSRATNLIPNGVSNPKTREAELIKEKYDLNKNSYVLFLGRIVPEKGLRYLIKAFKNVGTDKRLVIAGGASDTDNFFGEIRELAKEDKRVVFTGFVEGQVLEELYSNAYVYVLPSDLEGMPLSLLEAMSYGNCCLVSDISECVDVVQENAVVFKKGNIEHLKDQLQVLCDNQELVLKYQKEASDYICNKYNWDNVTKETLELYKRESE